MTDNQPTDKEVSLKGIPSAEAFGLSVTVKVRDYLASQHLWTARREALLCHEREIEVLAREEHQLDRRHWSHATTAVLSAVAFLEAMVNAVWQDAADQHINRLDGIPENAITAMGQLWTGKEKAERMMTLLGKFQLALVLAGRDRMPDGAEPFQSARVLIELRNALVHFKPEWHASDTDVKLVQTLKSKITEDLQFPRAIQPWFPNKVLGAGTARWACDSVIAFAKDWHERMGIANDFNALYIADDTIDSP